MPEGVTGRLAWLAVYLGSRGKAARGRPLCHRRGGSRLGPLVVPGQQGKGPGKVPEERGLVVCREWVYLIAGVHAGIAFRCC